MLTNFKVKVPASTANLGPGFDCFGLALSLYLTINVQLTDQTSIKLIGENLSGLPTNESNLIYNTIDYLFKIENKEVPPLKIEIESEIPLGKGLGSSGAAIVGGLLVGNQLLDNKYSKVEIYNIAAKLEGHPDNVGASLFGGFIITTTGQDNTIIEKIPLHNNLRIILAVPSYSLSTKIARGQIPDKITVKDAVYNIGHAALLATYILTNQYDKFSFAMSDKLHQTFRQPMVKGLESIINSAKESGIFGAALSGAGPTILLITDKEKLNLTKKILDEIIEKENIDVKILNVKACNEGAKLTY